MAQAAGVNSGGPNSSAPVQVPPQAQPAPSQKPDTEGSNAQQPPDGEIIYRSGQMSGHTGNEENIHKSFT
jgi:hypothetical protein